MGSWGKLFMMLRLDWSWRNAGAFSHTTPPHEERTWQHVCRASRVEESLQLVYCIRWIHVGWLWPVSKRGLIITYSGLLVFSSFAVNHWPTILPCTYSCAQNLVLASTAFWSAELYTREKSWPKACMRPLEPHNTKLLELPSSSSL
jgi:hypothetical protein